MAENDGPWKIGELADLILGSNHPSSSSRANPPTPQKTASGESPGTSMAEATYVREMVLVNPAQDAGECASRYADYWSDRGQTVAVLWVGESGIKIGFFDYLRRVVWASEIVDAIESGRMDLFPELVARSVKRFVIALVTHPGWENSDIAAHCPSVCALVEPSPNQLVYAYESLKYVARAHENPELSCFVLDALSARQATELSTRLQQMGSRFLGRDISFSGFRLAEQWPTSNLVAETFVSASNQDKLDQLQHALLSCIKSQSQEPELMSIEPTHDHSDSPQPVMDTEHEENSTSCWPVVRMIRADRVIKDPAQLDCHIADTICDICSDAVDTMPMYPPMQNPCSSRWVLRKNGARSIIVSAIELPSGALEEAAARLYPAAAEDEIVVLARNLTTDHRKTAQAMKITIRLYEVAQLPPEQQQALLLKDVTQAVA